MVCLFFVVVEDMQLFFVKKKKKKKYYYYLKNTNLVNKYFYSYFIFILKKIVNWLQTENREKNTCLKCITVYDIRPCNVSFLSVSECF